MATASYASLSWTLQKRMSTASTTNVIGRQKWLMILMVVGFGRKKKLGSSLHWNAQISPYFKICRFLTYISTIFQNQVLHRGSVMIKWLKFKQTGFDLELGNSKESVNSNLCFSHLWCHLNSWYAHPSRYCSNMSFFYFMRDNKMHVTARLNMIHKIIIIKKKVEQKSWNHLNWW